MVEEQPEDPKKRGRPAGKQDQKPRYRRTAQGISADKIKVAQMKLDNLKEAEEARLANKGGGNPKWQLKKMLYRHRSNVSNAQKAPPPTSPPLTKSRHEQLYDSWFLNRQ